MRSLRLLSLVLSLWFTLAVSSPRAMAIPSLQQLPNGLDVAWSIDDRLPLVDFAFVVRAGNRDDRTGKSGTADLLTTLMDQTGIVSGELERLGAVKLVSADDDFLKFSVHGLSEDAPKLLELFYELIGRPILSEKDFKAQRAVRAQYWVNTFGSVDFFTAWAHQRMLTANTPYGRGAVASAGEYGRLTLRDTTEFYQEYFVPGNCVLLIAGKVKKNVLESKLADTFGTLGQATAVKHDGALKQKGKKDHDLSKTISKVSQPVKKSTRVYIDQRFVLKKTPKASKKDERPVWAALLVDRTESIQASLRMGFKVPTLASEDRYALEVANTILGGFFSSRLNQAVRDKMGLTYGIESKLVHAKDLSELVIRAGTRKENIGLLARRVQDVVRDLGEQKLPELEVEAAKKYLIGRHSLSYSDLGSEASKWLGGYLLGMPETHLHDYQKKIASVSAEQVLSVVRSNLQLKDAFIVFEGPSKIIQKSLKAADQKFLIHQVDQSLAR